MYSNGGVAPSFSTCGYPQDVTVSEASPAQLPWQQTSHPKAHRVMWGCLCVLALANPTFSQLAYILWPDDINGVSLMQWFQGVIFLLQILLLSFVYRRYEDTRHSRSLVLVFGLGPVRASVEEFAREPGGRERRDRGGHPVVQVLLRSVHVVDLCRDGSHRMAHDCPPEVHRGGSLHRWHDEGGRTLRGAVARRCFLRIGRSVGQRWRQGHLRQGHRRFRIPRAFLCLHILRERPLRSILFSSLFVDAVLATCSRARQVALVHPCSGAHSGCFSVHHVVVQ